VDRRPVGETSAGRIGLRWALALFYGIAGYFQLTAPQPFLLIVPPWVPAAGAVVAVTGIAEVLGASGLIQPWSKEARRAAGVGLAVYAVCVWPANFQHLAIDLTRPDRGWGLSYHIPRLLAQPLIIWLALWAGEVTDWPFARAKRD